LNQCAEARLGNAGSDRAGDVGSADWVLRLGCVKAWDA
jgi:hypothetical protein